MTDQAGTPTRARIENLLWQHLEIIEVARLGAPTGVHASPVPDIGGINAAAKVIAAEIDNLTARLGAQVDLTIETEKQLGIVRATRDAYLRELGGLRDRLARADVGPRPTDERIADALEKIAASLSVSYSVGSITEAIKATDLFTGEPFQP